MGITNNIIKEMSKAVPNAVPSKSLRPVAKAIREKYGITEPVTSVMEALNKQFAENPEAAQAANQFRGNPDKILNAVEDMINFKQLRSDMQQPPRAGRQESIQPEPLTPPTVVSKAPVPALTQGAQLVAKSEPPLMDAIYTPPGGNEVPVKQLAGTPGQKLLPEAQPKTLQERVARETGTKAQSEAAQAIPESYKANGLAVPLVGATTLAGALSADKREGEISTGAETAKGKEVKRAPASPTAPSPQGGVGTKPTETKPVTGGKESQVAPTGALKSMGALATKIEKGASNKVSKPTLDELTGQLDTVIDTVNKDPRFNNTAVERDLQSSRAEAYKMYKEKADRNQLLGTVERAINAIAQFASAQAGFGTRQAGGNLPLSTADYGGQTEQAFREYQTDLGLLSEEQKAAERAKERGETLKEKEIGRRQKTILERIETERNALREAGAEKRARIAEEGREASLDAREARAIKRENDAIAKGNVKDITKNLSVLDAEVAALTSMLNPVKPADAVLGLNKYAALTGVDVGGVKEGIAAVSGISWKEGDTLPSFTSNKAATKEFATAELEKVRARRKELADSLAQYTNGRTTPPAATTTPPEAPPPPPTGQPTVSSGMVDMIDPQGRPLRVPENKVAELEAAGAKRK